jgi:hypothetical protein
MIDAIKDDTPLRLSDAAALAFPHGGVTASGLRREAARGTLAVSRIAGKDYTTLAAIRGMIERCRVEAKAHGCGSSLRKGAATQYGSSKTRSVEQAQAAALASLKRLSASCENTSPTNTKSHGSKVVLAHQAQHPLVIGLPAFTPQESADPTSLGSGSDRAPSKQPTAVRLPVYLSAFSQKQRMAAD